MSRGMPCQNTMESSPATLKINEKAMKYHFLPRKSIFALLKNSTLPGPFQKLNKLVIPNAPAYGRERNLTSSPLSCSPQELERPVPHYQLHKSRQRLKLRTPS